MLSSALKQKKLRLRDTILLRTGLFLLLFIPLLTNGQADIEGLKSQWRKDPNDVIILSEIVGYYQLSDIDSTRKYSELLSTRFQELGDEKSALRTQLELADALGVHGQADSGMELLSSIESTLPDDNELAAKLMLVKGKLLSGQEQHDQALALLYELFDFSEKQNLDGMLGAIYLEIANVLAVNDDLENSKKYYLHALGQAAESGDVQLTTEAYYQLCRIYNGAIVVNLDSSVYYGLKGAEVVREAGYEYGYVRLIDVVTAPVMRQGNYRRGLQMIDATQEMYEQYYFPEISKYYRTLNAGYAYEALGVYDSAMMKMREGEQLRPDGLDHHRLKYLILKGTGRYKESLEAFETYNTKRVDRIRSRHATSLSSMQARLEANRAEQELRELSQTTELQNLQLRQQQILLFGMIIVIVVLIVAALLIYRQRKLKQEQRLINMELEESRKRLEIENQYRESELKALRSQMNPHFIFNALNSIQEYIVLNEKKLAGKYLGKFADLMRRYLHHSQTKSILLSEEIEALQLYLELEQIRYGESLTYSLSYDQVQSPELISVPSLLIQPYVENALKHGLLHKETDRQLRIKFTEDKETHLLTCEIEDNGIGRARSMEINKMRNPTHKSFATSATKTRLELINQSLDQSIQVEILDLENPEGDAMGTRVILSIPV